MRFVSQRQLLANITLLPMAENVPQAICLHDDGTMQILHSWNSDGDPLIEAHQELWKKKVSSFQIVYAGKSKLLDQPVLKRPIHPPDRPLGLARVGEDNFDAELCRRTSALRHTRSTLRV